MRPVVWIAPALAALSLAGVDAGVNTAVDGSLWARFTANGGNWDNVKSAFVDGWATQYAKENG